MWRLSIVDDESNRTVVNLVRKQYTIGRAEENAVRLTERNISRHHATLERVDNAWVFSDLNSATGSFVNDQRVEAPRSLVHGDRLRLGDYEAVLTDSERESAEVDNGARETATVREIPPSNDALLRDDRLVVLEGTGVGAQYPVRESPTLIGRGEECDIALNDTSVSRQHCVLERDEHGRFQVLDKNSSNGVRVNGTDVTRITLYAGDIIELGDVQLQFLPRGTRFDPSVIGTRRTSSTKSKLAKLGPVALGLAVVGALVSASLLRPADPDPVVSRSAEASEAAILTLRKATELHARRDLEGAHRVLEQIAEGSTLRNSQEYRRIEAEWADSQLELAERSTDLDVQRSLLNRVAQTPSIDSLRRKQAADTLARLEQTRFSPDDLALTGPDVDAEVIEVVDEPPPATAALARVALQPPVVRTVVRAMPVKATVAHAADTLPVAPPVAVEAAATAERPKPPLNPSPQPSLQVTQAAPFSPPPAPPEPPASTR
jgi:ABC transport system ATP-binding/permease protein